MHLDAWTIALQTINFAVLVWLLHRYLYRPVLGMIDARRSEIEQRYAAVRDAETQARTRLENIAKQRAGIAAERDTALKSAATQAQDAADDRRAQAEREAQALLTEARRTLSAEREQALQQARAAAVDMAGTLAQRLLDEVPMQLRTEAWLERIEQHVRSLPAAEREGLIASLRDGAAITVVTAAALPPEIAEQWRQRINRMLHAGTGVTFRADAALIAGAELHFPTAILRLTWQSALAAMRTEAGVHADAH